MLTTIGVESAVGLQSKTTWSYGALFTGAFDAFFASVRRAAPEGVSVQYRMAAEADTERLACLCEIYGLDSQSTSLFDRAEQAARNFDSELDVLTMCAPCTLLSNANMDPRKKEKAFATTQVNVGAMLALLGKTSPSLVLMEQTAALDSHFPALRDWMHARLCEHPYVWHYGKIDAAALGAAHHRVRLGWVGVRTPECAD